MSIRALSFAGIYFGGAILALMYSPAYGVFTYIFEWHNHPEYTWWGDELPNMRWAMLIALITLAAYFIHRSKVDILDEPNFKPLMWLILMVGNVYIVSTAFAVLPGESMRKAEEWLKITINFWLMIHVITSYRDYRILIWVLIIGVANFGYVSWERGSNRDIGVMAPNATEENAISAHIVAVLPFFGIYFLRTKKRLARIFIALSLPFCLNLIILANSRAAFMGLIGVVFFALIWIRGRARWAVVVGTVLAAGLFFFLTNASFWERQKTTMKYEDEGSAMSRIYLWTGALKMLRDYPFGVGGEGYRELSLEYMSEFPAKKSVHSTYFAVLVDWGYLGFILWSGLIIHTFVILSRIKGRTRGSPALEEFYFEAVAVQLALIGVLIAGIFHSRQYAEIVYWLCAFAIMLRNIFNQTIIDLNRAEQEAELATAGVAGELEDKTVVLNPHLSR